MSITRVTSRQFNQDSSKAKVAAAAGPVIITDRGRPAHVLLTFEQYQKLTGKRAKIADLLAMRKGKDVPFEARKLRDLATAAEL